MTKKQKRTLRRILLSAVLLAAAAAAERFVIPAEWKWLALADYLVPYLAIGYDVLWKAVRNIGSRQIFDENFLMSVATLGALAVGFLPDGETEFPEAVFVMLFYQIGELFQSIAVGRSRRSISELMDIRPDTAAVERGGEPCLVDPAEVSVGEILVIRPGEKVPLDGVVIEGRSGLNTVALTGEAAPREVAEGDGVISGCVNLTGVLRVRVTKPFGESTVSKILDLVENSASNKSRSEAFITRFARWYTPLVVGAAVLLAFVPPLFTGLDFARWIARALTFLVISCPCALVISVPLTFFGGIGGASRRGILVKGSNYLEALSRAKIAVFDKTGTLTEGVFEVTAVHPERHDQRELLRLAALAECCSSHPVALSLCRAFDGEIARDAVRQVEELAGRGVSATVEGQRIFVGNDKLMRDIGLEAGSCHLTGTLVHVAIDGEYAGHIVISDRIKDSARGLVAALKAKGLQKAVMLTGDRADVADKVASELGIDEWKAELLPADKVEQVERLLAEKEGGTLLFVGDGINDAPVLSRADVGIAMGALGSDAAIEAADVVIMDDNPAKITEAMTIARKTLRIVRQNIWFALTVKLAILVLGALGITGLWMAVFADVGVAVLAILNAIRTLWEPKLTVNE